MRAGASEAVILEDRCYRRCAYIYNRYTHFGVIAPSRPRLRDVIGCECTLVKNVNEEDSLPNLIVVVFGFDFRSIFIVDVNIDIITIESRAG